MSVAAALESVVVAAVDMLGKPQERGEPLELSEPRLVAVAELRGSVPQSGRRRRLSESSKRGLPALISPFFSNDVLKKLQGDMMNNIQLGFSDFVLQYLKCNSAK